MSRPSVDQSVVVADVAAAFKKGDPEGAARILASALETDPENAAFHDLMAVVHYSVGRPADALPHARRAAELAPQVARFSKGEATVLIALERYDEAIARLEKILQANPGDVDARNDLGASYAKAGRFEAAEEQFRRALDVDPSAPTALFNLGVTLLKLRRTAAAEEQFGKLRGQAPDDPSKLFELGKVYWELDRCLAAEALLERALELEPDHRDALVVLGQIAARRGDFELAVRRLERARLLEPDNARTLECLGQIYRDSQKPEEAQEAYRAALAISPASCDALAGLSHFADPATAPELLRHLEEAQGALAPGETDKRLSLAFASARMLDRAMAYEKAWHQAVEANEEFRDLYVPEIAERRDFSKGPVPRINAGGASPEPPPQGAAPDRRLIIIAGMPRSGKSSAEELLAQVPDLKTGYENNLFSESIEELNERIGLSLVRALGDLPDSYWPQYLEILNAKLADRAGDCAAYTLTIHGMYILDAIPQLIANLPNAFLVLLQRDAYDNALRIFLSDYDLNNNSYSYRLPDIMGRIELWRSAVGWWTANQPERCFAVGYEEMVQDPSAALERISGLCGLPPASASPEPPFDDTGCAAPYREMIKNHLRD